MKPATRVVFALDVTDPDTAKSLARSVGPEVDAVKVGWALLLGGGRSLIRELARSGYLLCDFRTAETPNTTRLIVEQAVALGASGIVTQGFVGEDSVRAAVGAADGRDVFVIAEMSHPGGARFTAPHAEEIAKIAVDAGAAGIVAPATRPERIRALRRIVGSRLILSPGVGAQGGSAGGAIAAGADAVIVGRTIYEADDPVAAAKAIVAEARAAKRA